MCHLNAPYSKSGTEYKVMLGEHFSNLNKMMYDRVCGNTENNSILTRCLPNDAKTKVNPDFQVTNSG